MLQSILISPRNAIIHLAGLCSWSLMIAFLFDTPARAAADSNEGPPSMHIAIDYRLDLPVDFGSTRCTPLHFSFAWEGDLKPVDRAPDGKRPALRFSEHGPLHASVDATRTCRSTDNEPGAEPSISVEHYEAAQDATGVVTLDLFTETAEGRFEPLPRLSLVGFTQQPAVILQRHENGDYSSYISGFEFAAKGLIEGSALLPDFGFSEAEFRDGFVKTFRFWSEVGPFEGVESGTVTFSYKNGLQAIPVVTSTVARGETVILDGTKSTGNPKEYEWTFKRRGAASGGDSFNEKAVKKGANTSAVLLDSMDITLKVSDGKRSHEKTVSVIVTPRSFFRTRFEHVTEESTLPDGTLPMAIETGITQRGTKKYDAMWIGAENVCAIDPPGSDSTEQPHIFHPDPAKASRNEMYTIMAVADPGGPWDGFYYFRDWLVEIKRQTRINSFIAESAAPQAKLGGQNFYQFNLKHGGDVKGYLKAVRDHESDHSILMAQALEGNDPAKDAEKSYGKDAEKLHRESEARIRDVARKMHENAKDPRPEIWKGDLALPVKGKDEWVRIEMKVGGEGYGAF